MTIASRVTSNIGAKVYAPLGPFGPMGNFSSASFGYGDMVRGDAGSEFIFCKYCPTTSVTFNQGDCFFWDSNFLAYPTLAPAAIHGTPVGTSMGTLFLGGRLGDPAADVTGNIWSYAFAAGGVYGIWLQYLGASAINVSVLTQQYSIPSTTATAGSLGMPTGATHFATFPTGSVATSAVSTTATATTTSGSSQLSALTPVLGVALEQIQLGDYASGTGVPNGAYIVDINGTTGTITLSAAATASASVTVTFTRGTLWGTIPVASAGGPSQIFCQNVPAGVYPNCTISGTGLSSTTITSITGTPGSYVITVAGASTQELTLEQFTITGYYEGYLNGPFVSATT
jgi:hypothetical protein